MWRFCNHISFGQKHRGHVALGRSRLGGEEFQQFAINQVTIKSSQPYFDCQGNIILKCSHVLIAIEWVTNEINAMIRPWTNVMLKVKIETNYLGYGMAQPGGGLGYSRKAFAGHPLWAGTRPQCQTMLFKMTQRWSKTLWPVWRTFSTFSNYLLRQEGRPAFPILTFRCRKEEPPFQNHPFQARR